MLAALMVKDHSPALSKVVPKIEGSPSDLALTHAMFVAVSRDDPSLGNMITSGFTFHQGKILLRLINYEYSLSLCVVRRSGLRSADRD